MAAPPIAPRKYGSTAKWCAVISLAEYGKEVQLEVKNHRIAFISSDCPDKVCIHNGWLSREGEQAICLPNRVSVTLTDGSTVPVELN